jgi:hypothetical protein
MVNLRSSTRTSNFFAGYGWLFCVIQSSIFCTKNWRVKHFPSSWLGIMAGYDTFHRSTYANDLHMYNIYNDMVFPLHIYICIYNTMYSNRLLIYIYIWLYIPLTIQLRIHGQGSTAGSFAMNHPVMLDWYHGKVLVIQWFQLCHYDVYTIEYCHVCPSQTKCPKKIFTIWGEKTRKNGDFWGWCIEKTGLGT